MLRFIVWSVAIGAVLCVVAICAALVLVASPFPGRPPERDVFGFGQGRSSPPPQLPPLAILRARDGEALSYRLYEADSDRILIFLHGSSYHGGGYHELAAHVSGVGAAKVVLPNLRGHYMAGQRRGDVEHIGQLEEDIVDLIRALRAAGHQGPVVLGGHSSGGGLVVRFAGGQGPREEPVAAYLALAPIFPRTPAIRGGDAGGWNSVHTKRILGLVALNALGVHGFDGLPIIAFNKPAASWDGTETLAYSWRLNVSYHPRHAHAADVQAMDPRSLVLVGAQDEAVDGEGLAGLLKEAGYRGAFEVVPETSHFGIFRDPAALSRVARFIAALPSR